MKINLIFAHSQNNVIGCYNQLPWHLPEDLQHFRDLTQDQIVLMGRKTYESLPVSYRPLPGRINIVLSRDEQFKNNNQSEQTWVYSTVSDFIEDYYQQDSGFQQKELFIIGGQSVYERLIAIATRIYETVIYKHFEGDAYGPVIDSSIWTCVKTSDIKNYNGLSYQFKEHWRTSCLSLFQK